MFFFVEVWCFFWFRDDGTLMKYCMMKVDETFHCIFLLSKQFFSAKAAL